MNKSVKSFFVLLSCVSMLCFMGCKKKDKQASSKDGKKQIIATIFPEYDWIKEITKGSENVEVSLLLDSGIDVHSFQPTADDIMKLAKCDLLVYVGGESDEWVEKAIKESKNRKITAINLLNCLGDMAKQEELVEGMEEHEHEHKEHDDEEHEEHEHEHEEHEHEHEAEYDEHIWLSLKNAKFLCTKIVEALCKVDSANKELYKKNLKEYISKIESLDTKYQKTIKNLPKKTVLFGDRFPFRYLMDDYGLKYYAAFSGCSAESEASFDTIIFLSKKTDEFALKSIFKLENSDGKIASKIIENTKKKNQKVLSMNSMQSVTAKDIKDGASYIKIMEYNLETLSEALK